MNVTEPLLDRTYRLLDAALSASAEEGGLSYRKIAAGAGVDFNWVAKFAQRAICEPGVSKVQAVHDFLSTQTAATRKARAKQVS